MRLRDPNAAVVVRHCNICDQMMMMKCVCLDWPHAADGGSVRWLCGSRSGAVGQRR